MTTSLGTAPTLGSAPTVVFLHAHPDDEAIFTAATMHRLAESGGRAILVTATGGEEGQTRLPLRSGETLAQRRRAELEQACAIIGIDRLVLLGYRDSGMAGTPANRHRAALARADLPRATARLARLLEQESVAAVVSYDDDGIYGHPDHVAVHRLGAGLARMAGVSSYESTVDREYLHFVPAHLVEGGQERQGRPSVGRASAEISLAVRAREHELRVKGEAMAAHASQMPRGVVGGYGFAETYGTEWFTRASGPPVLEALGNEHVLAPPG